MTIDPDTFRAVLGRFASGVTVLTMRHEGHDHGMTVTAFCSVSLEPPLVLACVERTASFHPYLALERAFAVNILSSGQEALSRRFSGPADRFEGVGYTRAQNGAPLLDDALAHLECRVEALHPGGDHTVCLARVESAVVRPERPLLYYRGGYAQLER